MRLSVIAAVARNGVIGRSDGSLPWHLPTDLKYFRKLTDHKPVIMGDRTFLTLKRPLPARTNIILSSRPSLKLAGAYVVHSIDEAISTAYVAARELASDEIMVIGGGDVYAHFLPYAQRLYLTEVDADVEGDFFFPKLDPAIWHLVSKQAIERSVSDSHDFSFSVFERSSK